MREVGVDQAVTGLGTASRTPPSKLTAKNAKHVTIECSSDANHTCTCLLLTCMTLYTKRTTSCGFTIPPPPPPL